MASNFFNILSFVAKSRQNFKIVVRKVAKRFFEKKSLGNNTNENLTWIKNHCLDYKSVATELSPTLLEEAIQYSEALNKHSIKTLEKVKYKLGGGGIYPFLYFITRLIEPSIIIETGVAAGYTSQTFLSAIKKNSKGFLYSSDFPYFRLPNPEQYIGILVEDELKEFWQLHIKGDEINLPVILNQVKEIDIFHYDSDKSYKGRTYATKLISEKMSKNGFIIYDDIQDNSHFYDCIKNNTFKKWYIFEFQGKYIGVIGDLSKWKSIPTFS
jgi:predicted O-methyltransferase YrrM